MAHTGSLRYAPDVPAIPAAALAVPDAQLLERMVERGKPVRVHLSLQSQRHPAESWNVVGEIPGATDEVVLASGHLDSWDVGTGASDDGAGVAMVIAAAKLAGETHLKRTLRVVLFGGEENDVAGPAYAERHKDELNNIVLAGESDFGSEPVTGVALPAGMATHPALAELAALLKPLDVVVSEAPATGGGLDLMPMHHLGVPVLSLSQRDTRYLTLHHTDDDTLDKIVPAELAQNVAVWSVLLRVLGDAPLDR